MSLILRIVLFSISILTTLYVLKKIKKSQMQIEDSLFWFGGSFILIILSIFPGIVKFGSKVIGIISPVNFLFLAIIFTILLKLFLMSIKFSQIDNKLNSLVQEFALYENKVEKKNNLELQEKMVSQHNPDVQMSMMGDTFSKKI